MLRLDHDVLARHKLLMGQLKAHFELFRWFKPNVIPLFSIYRLCLGDSLLLANTIFQKALLQVRSLCENACSSGSGMPNDNEAISLVDTDWYSTMILGDFCRRQRLKVQKADEKLVVLRKKVVSILVAVCKVRQNCLLCLLSYHGMMPFF